MKQYRAIVVLLVLIFTVGAPLVNPPVFGQTNGLEMTATAAYDGYFKYGEWLPVWVELSNQGENIEDASIRIQVGGSSGTIVFAAPVSLPSGSRKRLPVYVLPNNFSRELTVQLVSGSRMLTSQKVAVQPQPNITYMVGLIAPERGALSLMTAIQLTDQNRPKVFADVRLGDLADRMEGLRSFDVLVLNDTDTSQLSAEQRATLESWVNLGGRLVLGGGASAAKVFSGLPDNLKPVTLQGTLDVDQTTTVDLGHFAGGDPILSPGPFLAAVGQPVAGNDGRLLAGNQSLPLVYEQVYGSGTIDFIAFDLAGAPFNGWSSTSAFWETLLGPGSSYPSNLPFDTSLRQMRGNQLYYALSNIPALDLPSVQGISLLLGIYILVVGPLNYLVLRWRRRLHWAWVTIPVITVLFTAGAFTVGYAMRGNDLILNQIALIEVRPNGTANVDSFLGLFSPRQQSYEIKVSGDGLVSPMNGYEVNSWNPDGIQIGVGEMVFMQGQPTLIQGLSVNQFSMQSFMSEDTWEGFGAFASDLNVMNDVLVGTVQNNTQYTLRDAVVAFQNRYVRLGDLEPGESASVDIGLGDLPNDRFNSPLSYRLFQEDVNFNGQQSRDVQLKTNILSSVFDNNMPWSSKLASSSFGSVGSSTQPASVVMFGWIDQAPPDVQVGNNNLSRSTTALVYSSLNYNFISHGYINLPVGLIPGNITSMPDGSGTCGVYGTTSVSMAQGEADFEYQVPEIALNAQIDQLRLSLWRDSGDVSLLKISLWDWENENWVTIQSPIQGVNVIEKAAAYVNQNGLIRVHVTSNANNMYSCIYLDMGLDAVQTGGNGGQP